MKFYTVLDLAPEEPAVVAVILESDTGGVAGAAIRGNLDAPDSPYRIITETFRDAIPVVTPRGHDRISTLVYPGQPGFVEAALHALRPPLAPGPRGTVLRVGTPTEMIQRTWQALSVEGSPLPMVSL